MPARTAAPALALLLALSSCAGSGPAARSWSPETPASDPSLTIRYAAGLTEDVYLPRGRGRVPLVVMVPGGSWTTSDPAGLAPLAADLAARGVAAAPIRIRAAEDGVVYPVPVEDVLCAVAVAVQRLQARGYRPDPVAVLGHSSGAHLAALAVLTYDDFSFPCRAPAVEPDALVGLSGPYDISRMPDVAAALFDVGPDGAPDAWQNANPVVRADRRPDVPVLLMHGEDDPTVPVDFTIQFANALEHAGHPVTVDVVPDVDHLGMFRADVAGEPVADWLLGLP
ncbi:alpha/beta hydrolase [Nocardioides aquiterrae]|uniref:BD-FAE-like domain-containing protein n=1 Tax=Nocardioides aquiterrae TaxID=203799 RepID=A0ABN1U8R6_9ACTN